MVVARPGPYGKCRIRGILCAVVLSLVGAVQASALAQPAGQPLGAPGPAPIPRVQAGASTSQKVPTAPDQHQPSTNPSGAPSRDSSAHKQPVTPEVQEATTEKWLTLAQTWLRMLAFVLVVGVVAAITVILFFLFVGEMRKGSETGIETHWGGFGGGLGGWSISRPLVYLLAALAFGCLLAVLSAEGLKPLSPRAPEAPVTSAGAK
jgi:hypothetical protein